jgi:hypothetical protein
MRRTTLRSLFGCSALLAVLSLAVHPAGAQKVDKAEGFTPLFNGTDLAGWKTRFGKSKLDTSKTFTVHGKALVVSGHPNGFIYTDKSYKNYVLRYDWRYKRPKGLKDDARFTGNSGCLVHIHNPTRPAVSGLWPQCVEVQGMNRDHGKLLFLEAKGTARFDKEAKDRAVRKVGEWNTTEITCKADGTISVRINGTEVSSGKSDLTEGHIGFQSEGAEIHLRNILLG